VTQRASTALLLAAGMGSRFRPAGDMLPKCLAEVDGEVILARLMASLHHHGVKRLIVVTGFMAGRIQEFAQTVDVELELVFIDNPDYASTNNIYSLWLARHYLHGPLVLLESDLVFNGSLLASMLTADSIAVSPVRPWMHGTTVNLDGTGRVTSFQLLTQTSEAGQYKTVNIYCLSRASWAAVLPRLEEHIAAGRMGSYYEIVFSEMVRDAVLDLQAVIFPADQWYEVDTIADQEAASALLASQALCQEVLKRPDHLPGKTKRGKLKHE